MTGLHVTEPAGFLAAGLACGIRPDRKDLALLWSDRPAAVAGMLTTNAVCAAPVLLCRQRLPQGWARAVLVNSGNANACTGLQGMADAEEMVRLASRSLEVSESEVLLCSTGVIGQPLPMPVIRQGIPQLRSHLSREGAAEASQAILTTDAFEKTGSRTVTGPQGVYRLGGMAKGAGMICPNMATTLAFVTCDAAIAPDTLQSLLKQATEESFHCISVDGDTSTNDALLVLANGASGVEVRTESEQAIFLEALTSLLQSLAKMVVRDGEGARCLVEIVVSGAASDEAARQVARTIAGSLLFKTMLAGGEPNWGRVLAAAGRAGVPLEESRCRLQFDDVLVFENGGGIAESSGAAAKVLAQAEFVIRLDLGQGSHQTRFWTCDIGHPYVELNGAYLT